MAAKTKRKSITYPAQITRRGTAHYVTIYKNYMEMLDVCEGDLVDVTVSVPEIVEMEDGKEESDRWQRTAR